MAVRVLWALVSLTGLVQPLPLCRSPLSVQGLAPSPRLSYAVGTSTSFLPSGGIPDFSPTSHPCLVDGPWNQLITLSEAVDGSHCYDHLALAHVQSLWDCVLLVRASAVPGHLWLLAHLCSWHSRVRAAP